MSQAHAQLVLGSQELSDHLDKTRLILSADSGSDPWPAQQPVRPRLVALCCLVAPKLVASGAEDGRRVVEHASWKDENQRGPKLRSRSDSDAKGQKRAEGMCLMKGYLVVWLPSLQETYSKRVMPHHAHYNHYIHVCTTCKCRKTGCYKLLVRCRANLQERIPFDNL